MFQKDMRYILFFIKDKVVDTSVESIKMPYWPMNLKEVKMKIMQSRNKIPANMLLLYQLPQVDIDEFNNAKDDKEFAEIIKRDAKRQGANLVDERIE